MENRFGIKDFVLLLLVATVLVLVVLSMKQVDRQWEQLRGISSQVQGQREELRALSSRIERGITLSSAPASTQPAGDDAFTRLRQAQALKDYAAGDWFVEAFPGGVAKLTPLLSGDAYAGTVQGLVLESLATRDPSTLEWLPLLAKKWSISDDGLVITFTMRDGPCFSDGMPLTADDVVFTYNFIMDPRIAAPRDRAYLDQIGKVEKKGANQVVFTYKQPYFQAFELAATMSVMPKHFYSRFKPEEFNESAGFLLGSGPYRLEDPTSWKPGSGQISLVRNENYWGVAPAFDRRVYREISNDKARLTAFRNGEVDLLGVLPVQYRELLQDRAFLDRTHHYEYLPVGGGYRFIAWNELREGKPTVFADKRVRQAMTMLIDRQRIIKEVQLGYAVEATGPFSPGSKQYNPEVKGWPFDVEAAKKKLAEAGIRDSNGDGILEKPDGSRFTIRLTYPAGGSDYEKIVLLLKDTLARVGIILEPQPLEWAIFTDRLNKRDFDAISLGWTSGIETDLYQIFHSSQMGSEGDDFVSYKNEELDRIIEQARRTVDDEKRMPLWRKAHAILNEDQPYTFLAFGKALVFIDQRVENVQLLKVGLNPREEWFVPRARQRWTR